MVKKSFLVLIFFEAELVSEARAGAPILAGYDDIMLAEARLCRKTLNQALTAFESGGVETILECVSKIAARLDNIDGRYQVDSNLITGMHGPQGDLVMKGLVFDCVPGDEAAAKKTTIDVCAVACSHACRSALTKFISPTAKGDADTCCELLSKLSLKTPPEFASGKMSPMVQEFIDKLSWLCTYQRADKRPHPLRSSSSHREACGSAEDDGE